MRGKGKKGKRGNGKRIIRQCAQCGKSIEVIPSRARKYKNCFCNSACQRAWIATPGNQQPPPPKNTSTSQVFQIMNKRMKDLTPSEKSEYRRMMKRKHLIPRQCKNCGKDILASPDNAKRGMGWFCDPSCAMQYRWNHDMHSKSDRRKISRICQYCGNDFKVWPSQVDLGWGLYCSDACKFASRATPDSQRMYCEKFTLEFREGVRAFFGYVCPECGTTQEANKKKLAVHHVYYNKKACCSQDENGNYIHTLPDGMKVLVVGDPNKFVPLCSTCHAKSNGGKKTPRLYWAKHFEEMINTYYGGKSYLSKEERLNKMDTIKNLFSIHLSHNYAFFCRCVF